MLFGVFATHSPESCPLNNDSSKKIFLKIKDRIEENLENFNVLKLVGFYMSVLEHKWIIIIDAKSAHEIEQFCIAVGISSISTVKIVPVNNYIDTLEKLKAE